MEKQIFMSASYYKQKYYANPKYEKVPVGIRNEMRDLSIMLAEKLHGIVTLGFYLDGEVFFEVEAEEGDHEYDSIGAQLEMKEVQEEYAETFKTMKLWYLMYQTDYGKVLREILILFNTEKKSKAEIIETLCNKYGESMRDTITEILDTVGIC